jgi:hypothetical protein
MRVTAQFLRTAAILIVSICAIFSAAAARAATLPTYDARPPSLRAPSQNEGTLVLTIVTNDARATMPDIVTVSSELANYQLRPVSDGWARNRGVYVGVLPAGRYWIKRFDDRRAFRWLELTIAQQELLGKFDVFAGDVADLGQIVITPQNSLYAVGRSEPLATNASTLAAFAPQSAAQLQAATWRSAWVDPRAASDNFAQYAATHPVGAIAVIELASGAVIAPTALGTLLLRQTNNQWSALRAPSTNVLLWAASFDPTERSIVAVGEASTIVKFAADGSAQPLPVGDLPPGNLIFIAGSDRNGWFVGHEMRGLVRVLRSDSLLQPKWQEIAQAERTFSVWSGSREVWLWPTRHGFMFADGARLRAYDYQSRAWAERETPGKNAIITVMPGADDAFGVVTSPGGGFGGITASSWISRDLGASWTRVSPPYKVKVSAPLVISSSELLQVGGVFGDAGLQGSTDGGQSWSKYTSELPANASLVMTKSSGLFALRRIGVHDIVQHSSDDGRTWTTEFSSLDRRVLEAQLTEERTKREAAEARRAAAKKTKR